MNYYINQFEILKAIASEQINQSELLLTVDRKKIFEITNKKYFNPTVELNFSITEEPIEEENWAKLPEKEKDIISELYFNLKKPRVDPKIYSKLEAYKEMHPNVPAIYNYLSIAYQITNQLDKYEKILFETFERFPNYIFGKISLCEYYVNKNDIDKVSVVLENKFEITQHFPSGTKVFHISAVRSFYNVTGRYFVKKGQIERAYKSYFLLYDLDKKHQTTQYLGNEILLYELKPVIKKLKKAHSSNKY